MPFKTRKRKEAAVERRFTLVESQKVSYQKMGSFDQVNAYNKKQKEDTKRIGEKAYVAGDLVKIAVVALIIIGSQVLLSLTLH